MLAGACSREQSLEKGAELEFKGAPVIVISVDTLRADRLPVYGYAGVETPAIDALRRDSVLFENAYAHVPLTLPSHVSLLTGLLPQEHGVRNNIGYPFDGAKHPTIATLLKSRGYVSGAAVSSYVLRSATGISSGFDFYEDAVGGREGVAISQLQRSGAATTAIAQEWIAQEKDQPFFFMLHLFEPHSPYEPPEPFRSRYANAYDGEVASVDAVVGSFIDFLKKNEIYDRAIIIFLSDHGEGLGDHGEDEHGIFLYREAIHVPLMIKLPDARLAPGSVTAPVQLIDVVPTVAQLVGLEMPKLQGTSLLAVAAEPEKPARRIFSETLYPRIHLGWSELRSLIDDRFHFIDAPKPELYAASDRAERANVLTDNRRVYASMRKDVESMGSTFAAPANIDPEEAAKLAALGYLGSTASTGEGGALPDPKDRIGEIDEMKRAFGLAEASRPAEAVDALRAIVAKNPRLTDAWNKLGMTLTGMGRYSEALEAYQTAIKQEPTLSPEFALSIGSLLLRMERYDEAAKHAELGRKLNPASADILLSRIALARGNPADGERHARAAIGDANFRWAASVALIEALAAKGDLPAALTLAEQTRTQLAAAKLPAPEGLDFARGDLYARMERNREAEIAFKEEIRNYPGHRQTYANLALLYMIEGRVDEARRLYAAMGAASPVRETYLFASRTAERLGDSVAAAEWRARAEKLPR